MTYIIKRDGRIERFDEEKLKSSIMAAAREAGLLDKRWVSAIIQMVAANAIAYARGQRSVKSQTLAEMILGELDNQGGQISDAWRAYSKARP